MTTVLLVEDQLELRAIHGTYLAEHGYRVLTASDGDAALRVTRAEMPDVIVMDHSLPHRTGVEVAQALRDDVATASIPVIMMTAHAYGAVGKKARAAGCVAFLAKPCNPSRVMEEIVRFTGERTGSGTLT